MRVRKQTVAEVVSEASARMADPNYSAMMVGGFVQDQPATAQYITAHQQEIGSVEDIVGTIFHASLVGLCYQRANGRSVPEMGFDDLDQVAGDELCERLENLQPALHEYINSNVESAAMRNVLYLVALAMDWVS